MKKRESIVLEPADAKSPYTLQDLSTGVVIAEDGFILYGPYIDLNASAWNIVIRGVFQTTSTTCFMDVTAEHGRITLARVALKTSDAILVNTNFTVFSLVHFAEFRIWASKGSYIKLEGIELLGEASKRKIELHEIDQLRLVLDESSCVDKSLIDTGYWEKAQLDYLRTVVTSTGPQSRHKLFLDIGAYFGLYSLQMLRLHFFDEIWAFEVDWYNYRQLVANLLFNDVECRIQPHNSAISNKTGTARFLSSLSHPGMNRGGMGLLEPGQSSPGELKVPVNALDDLVSLKEAIIFAKIDVEGHELEVLSGMTKVLLNNTCTLQIEFLDQRRLEKGSSLLENLKYRRINNIDSDYYFTNSV